MKKKTVLKTGIIVGAAIVLSPLWGIVHSATHTFHRLDTSGIEISSTTSGYGFVLRLGKGALCLCLLGIVIFVICIALLDRELRKTPPPLPHDAGAK